LINPASPNPAPPDRRRFIFASLGYFLAVVLFLFGRVLLRRTDQVLGMPGLDTATMIVPFRQFGFGEIAKGNLPLWNPHIFSGTPFLGNFQSALLYPPNWLHLVLPMATALNWGIALHVAMSGWFVSIWCRRRGIS